MAVNGVGYNPYVYNGVKKASDSNTNSSVYTSAPNFRGDEFVSSKTENKAEKRGSVNTWINEKIGYKTGCTDGKDDGKLSFGDKLKSIGRGILNFATNIIESVKEKPLQTLLTVGAVVVGGALLVGAGIVSAPALAIGGAAIGLVGGAIKIGQGISKASKATTDAEAKAAYESIGEGGATAAVSAFTMGKGVKAYNNGLKTARTSATESARSAQESANNAAQSATRAKKAVGSAEQSVKSAQASARSAVESADKTSKIATEFTNKNIRQASALAENSAQNAQNASQTAQKALANTQNSAGMSSAAAQDATKYAKEAAEASQKANQTMSLLRARKAAGVGGFAADSAKFAAGEAAGYANAAQMHAQSATQAAGIAASSAKAAGRYFDYALVKKLERLAGSTDTHTFGFSDSPGQVIRDDMRTRLFTNYAQHRFLDDALSVKDMKIEAPRVAGGAYEKLSKPVINREGRDLKIFENVAELGDATSVRGKIPLSGGNKTNFQFRLKKLQDANIKRVIDLRAQGECPRKAIEACRTAGVEYVNFPIEDANWTAQNIQNIPKLISAVNKGNYYIGCANGQARTDLAMAINHVFNPKAVGVPKFYYGSTSSTRVSIQGNLRQIMDNISPETIKELGWSDAKSFYTTATERIQQIVSSIR